MFRTNVGEEVRVRPSELFQLAPSLELSALKEEWRNLAVRLHNTSYFRTPDWVLSWWNTVGGQPFTLVATWRNETNRLEAIALLSRVRQRYFHGVNLGVRVWTNTGSGPGSADHCGWLACSNRTADVRNWLLHKASERTLVLQNCDPEVGIHLNGVARPVQQIACPRLYIPACDTEVGRSANFRQQLRAKRRKLHKAGVTLRWVDPPDMDEQVLESLFSLHEARWNSKNVTSNFSSEQFDLHRSLTRNADISRGPAAVLAEYREQVVGVLYGFWWKDVFAYYQLGWHPDWKSYSLGLLLLRDAIEMAKSRGARVFDFLRGDEPFKYRFGAEDHVDTTWIVPRSLSGDALTLAYSGRNLLRWIPTTKP